MRTSKFTEEQIVGLLREAEKRGQPLDLLCRANGITVQTFYRWRRIYGGTEVQNLRQMRHLETENGQLKRLLAERELDIAALKTILRKKWILLKRVTLRGSVEATPRAQAAR